MSPQPDWLDRDEFPFESRFRPSRYCNLHYVDEGQGETLLPHVGHFVPEQLSASMASIILGFVEDTRDETPPRPHS